MPEGYRLHGNTAANFSASITHNALEMHQWHDMEATVHSQFGTVDNPVLIFTSDSSWRIVICMGPAIEDDSHAHEKMYYFVREGPMHRCHVCGQCFKVVRLKDEASELNDYYSTMFADIKHFEVAEEDLSVPLTQYFGDRPTPNLQTIPGQNVYIHVNNDEADRILVDPAYKMEKMKEAHEKVYAFQTAYGIVDEQFKELTYRQKEVVGRDIYESWWQIEKSINKFDRIFNKVEKFDARAMTDPVNHERRERRLRDRRRNRWVSNYTFFFGNLTEEEQQYRDYFETDLEADPEDDWIDEKLDEMHIANQGQFNPALYDFVDYTQTHDAHESFDDVIEQKLFKYKYRQQAVDHSTYERRALRVRDRFLERAKTRDPILEQNLTDLFASDARDSSLATLALEPERFRMVAQEETRPFREYMVDEAVQQYKDYYESDDEENRFFEYLDNATNRDRIRFMEIFEDYTVDPTDGKEYVMIEKREYNPELSVLSNMVLDLVDFKDRVRPLSNDIAMLEQANKYQKQNAAQLLDAHDEYSALVGDINAGRSPVDSAYRVESADEGYSSIEVPEKQTAAEEIHESSEAEMEAAAEPDLTAPVEEPVEEVVQEVAAEPEPVVQEPEPVEEEQPMSFETVADEPQPIEEPVVEEAVEAVEAELEVETAAPEEEPAAEVEEPKEEDEPRRD